MKFDRSRLDSFSFPILFSIHIYMVVSHPSLTLIVSWTDVRRLCKGHYDNYQSKSILSEPEILRLETSINLIITSRSV